MINYLFVVIGFRSRPISQDLPGLAHLVFRPRELDIQPARFPRDRKFNGRQAAPLHAQVELLVSFFCPVPMQTGHA
jgi:hypothetical protein